MGRPDRGYEEELDVLHLVLTAKGHQGVSDGSKEGAQCARGGCWRGMRARRDGGARLERNELEALPAHVEAGAERAVQVTGAWYLVLRVLRSRGALSLAALLAQNPRARATILPRSLRVALASDLQLLRIYRLLV